MVMMVENDKVLDNWESQVRKGMLDFIILHALRSKERYGYEMIKTIKAIVGMNISEGTIYPLLNRLDKEGMISSRWIEKETGIPRKYYQITEKGSHILKNMDNFWEQFVSSLRLLIEQEK